MSDFYVTDNNYAWFIFIISMIDESSYEMKH